MIKTSGLLLAASLVGSAVAQIGIGLPCIVGSRDVCLNANVLTLADANANVVLKCVNGVYQSSLCVTGSGCQGGVCVNLLGTPSNSTTAPTNLPTNPIIQVGVPCVLGLAADACLNPNVGSLLDANANVILRCVNGAYAAQLCPTGEGCQQGACVVLLGEPGTGAPTGTAPTDTTPASTSPTGTDDSTGNGGPSTDSNGNTVPSSTFTGDTDPIGRGGPTSAPNSDPYGRGRYTTTEYITITQCFNGQCEYAEWCNVYEVCDSCYKPPTIECITTQSTTKACPVCQEHVDTIVFPYCAECETATACPATIPAGCNTCQAVTITVSAGKTTPSVPLPTIVIPAATTINYPATTPAATPACATCGIAAQTPSPSLPVFISSSSSLRAQVIGFGAALVGVAAFLI